VTWTRDDVTVAAARPPDSFSIPARGGGFAIPNCHVDTRSQPRAIRRPFDILARMFWTVAVVAILVGTGGTAIASNAYAGRSTIIAHQPPKPPPAAWGACPNNGRENVEHKLVRPFERTPGVTATGATMPGGVSDLVCGRPEYGDYHMVNRDYVEWNGKSIRTSENWRHVADYAIAEALKNPQRVTFRPRNNTFCYSREIYLVTRSPMPSLTCSIRTAPGLRLGGPDLGRVAVSTSEVISTRSA
jgi:hypothetical protein